MTADTSVPSHSSRPTTVVLLRSPIPPAQGTDPYHDAFGSFCLPSFPMSALDSGAATPLALPPKVLPPAMSMISEALGGTAQAQAQQGQQGPRPEELLLGALQKQKQDNARGGGRASSPQRNYTRQQAAYDGPQAAAATASSSSASSSSMTLTTHHIAADPQREWCIVSLPVLGSRSTNHKAFDELLLNGEWSGVVATSNRAWDAWKEATIRCAAAASGEQPKTHYATTPFFLISARSAASFRNEKIKGVPEGWAPAPTKVYGAPNTAKGSKGPAAGDDDGDPGKGSAGEALGQYILNWLQYQSPPVASASDRDGEAPPPPARKPLLILQGDKSLPALTSLLTERDTPFKTCVVYETCADSGLAKSLGGVQTLLADLTWTSRIAGGASPKPLQRAVLRSASGAMEGDGDVSEVLSEAGEASDTTLCPDWLVFFSPSGVDFTAEELRRRGWLPPPPPAPPPPTEEASADVTASTLASQRPRILAIGPTTAAHLQEMYGLHDVVVAEKPEPAGVREGILRAEGGQA